MAETTPEYVHKANERKLLAEAQKAELEAESAALDLERERYAHEVWRAHDAQQRLYRFLGEVSTSSVKACIDTLAVWSRMDGDQKRPMTIEFQSPGGDVVAGLALWDFLQDLRRDGHHLTTSTKGYAASMAGILLQAGDHRVMGKEAWILIHEASFGAVGSFGDVADKVEWIKRIQERILDIFAERSNLSKQKLRKGWDRKDWWISSDEALQHGLVDEVA